MKYIKYITFEEWRDARVLTAWFPVSHISFSCIRWGPEWGRKCRFVKTKQVNQRKKSQCKVTVNWEQRDAFRLDAAQGCLGFEFSLMLFTELHPPFSLSLPIPLCPQKIPTCQTEEYQREWKGLGMKYFTQWKHHFWWFSEEQEQAETK